MRIKRLVTLALLAVFLLAGCGNEAASRREANVNVDWRNFTLTNAKGKKLVMDHDRGYYPDGNMKHGDFDEITGSPAKLSFQVPHSDRFVFEHDGGEFSCNIATETYGGGAHADAFGSLELSAEWLVLTGVDTDFRMTMDLNQDGLNSLSIRSHTLQKVTMQQEGSLVTINGIEGEYTLELWKEVGYWQEPIQGTTQTGTLVIDLSRVMKENILTITDGDAATEYEVKKS